MNAELDRLLRSLEPPTRDNEGLRLRFGLCCVRRVEHLLEDAEVKACLRDFSAALARGATGEDLRALAERAGQLANHHPGSPSLDGVGHAAVSASYAVAKAMAGRARQAAEYAAYAAVYGEGGYGATRDAESFAAEYEWQAGQWHALLQDGAATLASPR